LPQTVDVSLNSTPQQLPAAVFSLLGPTGGWMGAYRLAGSGGWQWVDGTRDNIQATCSGCGMWADANPGWVCPALLLLPHPTPPAASCGASACVLRAHVDGCVCCLWVFGLQDWGRGMSCCWHGCLGVVRLQRQSPNCVRGGSAVSPGSRVSQHCRTGGWVRGCAQDLQCSRSFSTLRARAHLPLFPHCFAAALFATPAPTHRSAPRYLWDAGAVRRGSVQPSLQPRPGVSHLPCRSIWVHRWADK
jgi:hypothetical protein